MSDAAKSAAKRSRAIDRLMIVLVQSTPGPRNPDPQAPLVAQALTPSGEAVGGRMEIGNFGRNGIKRGAEGERQAHERTMQIKIRQQLAARKRLRNAIHARQQRLERGLDLEQNDRAPERQRVSRNERTEAYRRTPVPHATGSSGPRAARVQAIAARLKLRRCGAQLLCCHRHSNSRQPRANCPSLSRTRLSHHIASGRMASVAAACA